MHKKFEVNRTKTKGDCQSYTKTAPQQSWSDLTLVELKNAFGRKINFFWSRNFALAFVDLLFVHNLPDIRSNTIISCEIKNPNIFYNQNSESGKMVIKLKSILQSKLLETIM